MAGAARGAGRGIAAELGDYDEHGHIDILVNDIWGAEMLTGGPLDWNTPVWRLDLDKGLRILRLEVDTHR